MINNICSASQGLYEPTICASRYYCPLGGKQQLPCPKGHYCPAGSHKPSSCSGISLCPSGTWSQRPITGLTLLLIIDLCLVLCAIFPRIRRRLSRQKWVPNLFASAKRSAESHGILDSETGDVACFQVAKSLRG